MDDQFHSPPEAPPSIEQEEVEGLQSSRVTEGEERLSHSHMEEPHRMRNWEDVAHIPHVSGLLHLAEPEIPGPHEVLANGMVYVMAARWRD